MLLIHMFIVQMSNCTCTLLCAAGIERRESRGAVAELQYPRRYSTARGHCSREGNSGGATVPPRRYSAVWVLFACEREAEDR
jgi:hypothetical protein